MKQRNTKPYAKSKKTVEIRKPMLSIPLVTPLNVNNLSFQPSWIKSNLNKNSLQVKSVNNNINDQILDEVVEEEVLNDLHQTPISRQPFQDHSFISLPFSSSSKQNKSKAKFGTLRYKLQKVIKDSDGNENRILNIASDVDRCISRNGSIDLQDPRNRSTMWLDTIVISVLDDKNPFKVALLSITHIQNNKLNKIITDGEEFNQQPKDNNDAHIGQQVTAYFKPDTCRSGSNRELRNHMNLRFEKSHLFLSIDII